MALVLTRKWRPPATQVAGKPSFLRQDSGPGRAWGGLPSYPCKGRGEDTAMVEMMGCSGPPSHPACKWFAMRKCEEKKKV